MGGLSAIGGLAGGMGGSGGVGSSQPSNQSAATSAATSTVNPTVTLGGGAGSAGSFTQGGFAVYYPGAGTGSTSDINSPPFTTSIGFGMKTAVVVVVAVVLMIIFFKYK